MQSVSESVTLFVGSFWIQKVRIIRLEPGSIRVHMVLDPDICGGGEAPADVANLLAQQAADPRSPLKQVTMHTNILFLTAIKLSDLGFFSSLGLVRFVRAECIRDYETNGHISLNIRNIFMYRRIKLLNICRIWARQSCFVDCLSPLLIP